MGSSQNHQALREKIHKNLIITRDPLLNTHDVHLLYSCQLNLADKPLDDNFYGAEYNMLLRLYLIRINTKVCIINQVSYPQLYNAYRIIFRLKLDYYVIVVL